MNAKIHANLDRFKAGVFVDPSMSPATSKDFEKCGKELATELNKRCNEVRVLEAKLARRSFRPEDVIETLTSAQALLKNSAN